MKNTEPSYRFDLRHTCAQAVKSSCRQLCRPSDAKEVSLHLANSACTPFTRNIDFRKIAPSAKCQAPSHARTARRSLSTAGTHPCASNSVSLTVLTAASGQETDMPADVQRATQQPTTDHDSIPKKCYILGILPELRLHIYQYVYDERSTVVINHRQTLRKESRCCTGKPLLHRKAFAACPNMPHDASESRARVVRLGHLCY